MKRLAFTLAAAALFAAAPVAELMTSQTVDAQAQGRRGKAAAAAPKPGGDTAKGMAEAPAVVQASGLKCAISEASFLGATSAGEKLYEVACSDGPGHILIANADATIKGTFECVQLRDGNAAAVAAGKPDPNALSCKLPGNADPVRGLTKVLAPLVPGCTADAARWLGASNGGKDNIYELGCAGRPGAVVRLNAGGAPLVTPCARTGGNLTCELTSADERLTPLRELASKTGRACQVSDGRYVGSSETSKEDYFELKCAEGAGFMVVANQGDASFKRLIECSRAQNVGGGCTLTDAVEAQTAEAGVYKALATKAGFNCDVGEYRLLGREATGDKREVVELTCKNQPEGVIGFFPAGATGSTALYDCTKNWRHRQSCSLTKLPAIKPRLTRDVAKFGKSCDVTGFRGAGMTSKGKTEFVEVACSSGPGFMVEYAAENAPLFAPATGVFTCAEAKNIGEGCKLAAGATAS